MIKAIACLIYNFGDISTDDNSRATVAPPTVHIIHDLVQQTSGNGLSKRQTIAAITAVVPCTDGSDFSNFTSPESFLAIKAGICTPLHEPMGLISRARVKKIEF